MIASTKNRGFSVAEIVIVVAIFLAAGIGGGLYWNEMHKLKSNNTACTQEAKICPDGKTYVGRTGPNCEFQECSKANNEQEAVNSDTKDWKIYIDIWNRFEFKYPASWKRVADANSSDGITITVIYPISYPAQDFSARIAVYQASLATTKQDNPLFQNKSSSTVVVNNISWTKIQMTYSSGRPRDSFEYLTERNGKTYDVGGSSELTNSILSAFKFTE